MDNLTLWGLFLYVVLGITIGVIGKYTWKKKERSFSIKNSIKHALYRQQLYNEHYTKIRIALLFWIIGVEFFVLYLCIGVSKEVFIPPICISAIMLTMSILMNLILIIRDIVSINKSK